MKQSNILHDKVLHISSKHEMYCTPQAYYHFAQRPSLLLVTNQQHFHTDANGREGPQASELYTHSLRGPLTVLLGPARFFCRAACGLVTRQADGPSNMDSDGT